MHTDRSAVRLNGWAALLVILGLLGCSIALFISTLVSLKDDMGAYLDAQTAAEASFDGKPVRSPILAPVPVRPNPARLAFPLVTTALVFVMSFDSNTCFLNSVRSGFFPSTPTSICSTPRLVPRILYVATAFSIRNLCRASVMLGGMFTPSKNAMLGKSR